MHSKTFNNQTFITSVEQNWATRLIEPIVGDNSYVSFSVIEGEMVQIGCKSCDIGAVVRSLTLR